MITEITSKFCSQIIRLERGLDKQDQVNLYKLSILLQPLKHKRLATYLDQKNIDLVRPFVKQLIENRIFDEQFKWFRHELIQRCFEDDLDDEERRNYHERAADFFESLMEEEKRNRQANDNTNIEEEAAEEGRSIVMSYSYHLHMAGGRYHENHLRITKMIIVTLILITPTTNHTNRLLTSFCWI